MQQLRHVLVILHVTLQDLAQTLQNGKFATCYFALSQDAPAEAHALQVLVILHVTYLQLPNKP
jgi:hypothetical protein